MTLRLIAVVGAISMLLVSCAAPSDADSEASRVDFVVEGMHCDSCSSAIAESLQGVEGVSSAGADHEKGTADAVFDPGKVNPDKLKIEIEDLGFAVTSMVTEPVQEG